MTDRRQRHHQLFAGNGAGWQAETQQCAVVFEAACPDPVFSKRLMHAGHGHPRQPVERSAAHADKSVAMQHPVKRLRLVIEALAHGLRPITIGQCLGGNGKRRAGHGPGAQSVPQRGDEAGGADGKAEAQTGKAIEFAEGPQSDGGLVLQRGGQRMRRRNIDEGFIHHQPATLPGHAFRQCQRLGRAGQPAIRVVGMHDDGMANRFRQRLAKPEFRCGEPCLPPCPGMLAVGGTGNADKAGLRREAGQPLDDGLRARRGHNVEMIGHGIGAAGGGQQIVQRALPGQRLPAFGTHGADRISERVDAGGKVEPVCPRSAEPRHCLAKIAAMFHGFAMAWTARLRQPRLAFCTALALGLGGLNNVQAAAPPQRIVSINMCTDQLLLDLARPEQIAALSPFAADPLRSWMAAQARPFARVSGSAEEVLVLQPDLVVGGRFTRRTTREFIRARGFRLEEFDAVRSIAETKAQILKMGEIVGNPDKARQRVAEIDAALARLRAAALPRRLRILPIARRGWVSGAQSLTTDVLAQAGLVNVAAELGFRNGGFASLEAIVQLQPDALLMARDDLTPEDQGTAKLVHPALAGRFPPARRLTMPEKLMVCGGAMLAEAIDHLAREIQRIGPAE